ncbi:hypothetical protein KEJ15_01210 [Candidatus Bathyarchaeota archaeon]|nr:hypothetical protein [Candidatus Bathyarchaeota archaeon]
MVKKLIIEMVLVPESFGKRAEEIERDILEELRHGLLIIPWCDKVERVRVVE